MNVMQIIIPPKSSLAGESEFVVMLNFCFYDGDPARSAREPSAKC